MATPSRDSVLSLQVAVVVVAGLYLARDVLIPVTVAGLLSFLLAPLVDRLRGLGLGRVLAVILAASLALCVFAAIGAAIWLQLSQLAPNLPEYGANLYAKGVSLLNDLTGRFSGLLERFGGAGVFPTGDGPGQPASPPMQGEGGASGQGQSPASLSALATASNYLSPVLSPFATTGIVIVVAIFILLQKEDLRDRAIRLFGSKDLHRTTIAMDDAGRRLSRYFLTLLIINSGFGVAVAIGLFFLGVPNPILWGILGAVLRFVPYIGPIIGAVLPVALAAAVGPDWTLVLWTAGLFLVTELIFNQVVEPVAYGQSTGLSPVAVILSALFWGWLWGPIGLVLSMPLTLGLVVLGRHVSRLEFIDVLLGDRPALSPAENFYQRMLAGDPDEAQEHAEVLLRDRSLSSYYDEVALKGLQLAGNDLQRGILGAEQLTRIKETARSLIDALSEHDDVTPPAKGADKDAVIPPGDERSLPVGEPPGQSREHDPVLRTEWKGDAPILCLAGKGELDEATSSMLAQLLKKHGLGARVMPYEAASRLNIQTTDLTGCAMICISYLDISGSPAHLRYLIRRLRVKVPGAAILVGLWPAEDSVLRDRTLQVEIGADHYTTSLRAAVDLCIERSRAA